MAHLPERRAPRGGLGRYTPLVLGAGATVVAMGVVALVGGDSGGGAAATPVVASATTVPGAPASTATAAPGTATSAAPGTAATAATDTTDPGALPQTDTRPDASSAAFTARVDALWSAIKADDPARAMPCFFPLAAYRQIKAISDPTGDWNTRLVAAYEEDIHAWHAQLGTGAANAKLVNVTVPDTAEWIVPGVEYNSGSYWRVYGATLQYQVDGRGGTFTVASMISWRGEWYVVHLASIR
jgi:hypothetical protein